MTLIPLPAKTPCADGSTICMCDTLVEQIYAKLEQKTGGHDDARFMGIDVTAMGKVKGMKLVHLEPVQESPEIIEKMKKIKEKLGCDTEECVLEKAVKLKIITRDQADDIQESQIKPIGPMDNEWFDNVNIYGVLKQWMRVFPGFYAFDYVMRDFAKYPEEYELNKIKPHELYARGFRTYGVVCNTDKHGNNGQHWVAIFCDMRDSVWTVEFFNSTGNSYADFIAYTEDAAADLRAHYPNEVRALMASRKMHQRSNSECGPYSVYYIWARLNKIPHTWFEEEFVPDRAMYEFRKVLFSRDE